jgi:hypothetical protein
MTSRRQGLTGAAAFKVACACSTTASLTLSGEQTVDGFTTSASRVLVKNQTDSTQNGIYNSSSATWTRADDFDGNLDVVTGTLVFVINGTTNGASTWYCTATAPIVIGTSLISFAQVPNLSAQLVSLTQLQNSSTTLIGSVAGTNVITGGLTPALTAYAVGQRFTFIPANTNGGATTLNIDSRGAGAVQLNHAALVGGEIRQNVPVEVEVTAATPVFEIIGNGSMVTLAATQTLTNKTLTNPTISPLTVTDATFTLQDDGDNTKKAQFQLSGISAGATRIISTPDQDLSLVALSGICEGRLTLTSGTAITTSDVTAATTVYFTPYKGSRISTYNGTAWNVSAFAEKSVSVPATTSTPFDVFIVDGTLALETVNWTNDTTRATAIALQNGVYVKSGTTTRRYLGTCRTTAVSGQTEDSIAKRYLWNYYNPTLRKMLVQETTSTWTYTTATYRQANGSATNQLDFVVGVQETIVKAVVNGAFVNSGATNFAAQVGIGIDSTTVNSADLFPRNACQSTNAAGFASTVAQWGGFAGVGRHTLAWLEISPAAGTTTWSGTSADTGVTTTHSGIGGELWG